MNQYAADDHSSTQDLSADGIINTGEPLMIANEFTSVTVRKVLTRNGERVEVATLKSGDRVLLDAMQLEVISTLSPDKFNELFARNLGSYDGWRDGTL